ncbi:MAG: methyltransferase domain-containing protein [Actinomycetota bacterium]
MSALERWRRDLESWAVPDEIIAAAPESPWGFPPGLFAERAASALRRGLSPSVSRALEALPEDGTVLDVGVGGGAGSLPLAPRARLLTGVDSSQSMLDSFAEAAARRGVASATVLGTWPAAAGAVDPADVVICHHVFYNAADLGPFVQALSEKAVRRVVVEMTPEHPLAWMRDLWERFHGLTRPDGPTWRDALEVVRELGLPVQHLVTSGPPVMSGFADRRDAVALVRKRVCLQPDQDTELAEALGDRLSERGGLWTASPPQHEIATLWWDTKPAAP